MSRDRTQTPAATALLAALRANPDSTGAALALAAGIGRSTATKTLAAWEKQGIAVRTPGGRTGERPQPDRWSPAPTEQPTDTPEESAAPQDTTATIPSAAEEHAQTAEPDGAATVEAPATPPAVETADGTAESAEPSDSTAPATPAADEHPAEEPAQAAAEPEETAAPDHPAAPTPESAPPADPAPAAVKQGRLAPGELRAMTLAHLRAHPEEAFSPTKLGRLLGRSSGAIANALVRSLNDNEVELLNAHPLSYRAAPTQH